MQIIPNPNGKKSEVVIIYEMNLTRRYSPCQMELVAVELAYSYLTKQTINNHKNKTVIVNGAGSNVSHSAIRHIKKGYSHQQHKTKMQMLICTSAFLFCVVDGCTHNFATQKHVNKLCLCRAFKGLLNPHSATGVTNPARNPANKNSSNMNRNLCGNE